MCIRTDIKNSNDLIGTKEFGSWCIIRGDVPNVPEDYEEDWDYEDGEDGEDGEDDEDAEDGDNDEDEDNVGLT